MAKKTILELGDTAVCSITVKSGVNLTDPTTSMKITITDPDGTAIVNDVAMTKDSTGTYHYDYLPVKLGIYTVTYTATDTTRVSKHKDQFRVRSAT